MIEVYLLDIIIGAKLKQFNLVNGSWSRDKVRSYGQITLFSTYLINIYLKMHFWGQYVRIFLKKFDLAIFTLNPMI